MSKNHYFSEFDTSRIYDKGDMIPFDVSAYVDGSGNFIVTDTQDSSRIVGTFGGAIGDQVNDIVLDASGNIIVKSNNEQPDVIYHRIKRDFNLVVYNQDVGGPGVATGEFIDIPNRVLADAQGLDSTTIDILDTTYYYSIPNTTQWTDSEFTASYAGITVTASSVVANTNISNILKRDPTLGFIWGSGDSAPFIDINFPHLETINAIQIFNIPDDINNHVSQYEVLTSIDGHMYTSLGLYNTPVDINEPVHIILPVAATIRSIKVCPIIYSGNGSIGTIDILTSDTIPTLRAIMGFKKFVPDDTYFDLIENESSYDLRFKSAEDISSNLLISDLGLLSLNNYYRIEDQRTSTNSEYVMPSGFSAVPLNVVTIDNLDVGKSINVDAGTYYIRGSSIAYRGESFSTRLIDSTKNIPLLHGSLAFSHLDGNGSTATSTLEGIITLSAPTTLLFEVYRQTIYNAVNSQGKGQYLSNDIMYNTFGYLEMWKTMDESVIFPADTIDPYWNKTVLLINGLGGISDSSAYGHVIYTSSPIPTVPANHGTGFNLDASAHICTVPHPSLVIQEQSFTLDCWVMPVIGGEYMPIFTSSDNGSVGTLMVAINELGIVEVIINGINTTVEVSNVALQSEIWSYISLVCDNGTYTIYINGAPVGSFIDTTALTSSSYVIGHDPLSKSGYIGILSDIRLTIGAARYDSMFAVPTTILSSSSNK